MRHTFQPVQFGVNYKIIACSNHRYDVRDLTPFLAHHVIVQTRRTWCLVNSGTCIYCTGNSSSVSGVLFRRKCVLLVSLPILLVALLTIDLSRYNSFFNRKVENVYRYFSKKDNNYTLPEFDDVHWCNVSCRVGIPCEYVDEVNLRVIVITYNRASSLQKCLNHVMKLETLGDAVSVEVWLDRSKTGVIDQPTLRVARSFQRAWSASNKGHACVHMQESNAFIVGQWVDTWRPKENSNEMGLILEDDVDISPWAYKWLRAAHRYYGNHSDVMGYALQMQNNRFQEGKEARMGAPKGDAAFMYRNLATWGYSPHPRVWPRYQDWYHRVRRENKLKPYVRNLRSTRRRKRFEKKGTEESQWVVWHTYFAFINNYYCVFSNLIAYTGKNNVLLSHNRMEPGLHFKGRGQRESKSLLTVWNDRYVNFPNRTNKYDYNGSVVGTM